MATLVGVDRRTGKAIAGVDHLRQSIEDLITTRVGSRVMRPEYGSYLPGMVDLGVTPGLASAYQAEVSRAIQRWYPIFAVKSVRAVSITGGQITFSIAGVYQGDGLTLDLTV